LTLKECLFFANMTNHQLRESALDIVLFP